MMDIVSPSYLNHFHSNLMAWYRHNKREFPWRQSSDPYLVLLSEILLQQTDVAKVEKAYKELIIICPDIYQLNEINEARLMPIFKETGLIKRVKILKDIASIVIAEHNGIIPNSKEVLQGFKGIGEYISNALLCFAFGESVAIVDTNIIRILARVFEIRSNNKRPRDDKNLQFVAEKIVYEKDPRNYNYALLDFASLVCKLHNPLCDDCPLRLICCKEV